MPDFRNAIFAFESTAVPDELKVVDSIVAELKKLPVAAVTLIQVAHTLEEAAPMMDQFKAQTCGSPYSLSIINLNMMSRGEEINFLLHRDVMGDPRTIFLASLRHMHQDAYGLAREKIQRESEVLGRVTSCIDCYGAANRDEVPARIAELAAAYVAEAEEWEKARREGKIVIADANTTALLKKSRTAFYGSAMKSGIWKATNTAASGRFQKPGDAENRQG
ncbi:MAG: hypothetical protein NTW87_19580 [Planctomycetota bacterium]|nr:hypothetical protein [Planctomycetota bacterium]